MVVVVEGREERRGDAQNWLEEAHLQLKQPRAK